MIYEILLEKTMLLIYLVSMIQLLQQQIVPVIQNSKLPFQEMCFRKLDLQHVTTGLIVVCKKPKTFSPKRKGYKQKNVSIRKGLISFRIFYRQKKVWFISFVNFSSGTIFLVIIIILRRKITNGRKYYMISLDW